MHRVNEVLKWANRRAVAREITERGYRVSGETLNRWVRDDAEVPAIVEHIVFDLFGIVPGTGKEPPPWAEALTGELRSEIQTNRDLIQTFVRKQVGTGMAALQGRMDEYLAEIEQQRQRVGGRAGSGRSRDAGVSGPEQGPQRPRRTRRAGSAGG